MEKSVGYNVYNTATFASKFMVYLEKHHLLDIYRVTSKTSSINWVENIKRKINEYLIGAFLESSKR